MGAEPTSVGELDRVRIEETSVGADEVELARSERLFSVSGELADDFFLPRMDGFHVGTGGGNFEAERGSFLREMEHVSHVKERLGRHTAAKDTETPEVAGTVDDGGAETEGNGDAGGVEAGAAAAEDEEIVRFHRVGEAREAGRRSRERGSFLAENFKRAKESRAAPRTAMIARAIDGMELGLLGGIMVRCECWGLPQIKIGEGKRRAMATSVIGERLARSTKRRWAAL